MLLPPFYRPSTATYRPFDCRSDVLVLTDPSVDHAPLGIEHSDIGRRGRLEGPDRRAVAIPQERERHRMLLEMATHRVLALIHRDRDDEKLRAITELPLRRFHPRQQLSADRAPRRPEFDDNRLLADPLRQPDRIAVQILNRDCRMTLTDRNTNDFLSAEHRGCQKQ